MSEILIYAMSTKGELRIEQFNEIFKTVYLPAADSKEEGMDTTQLVRLLDSLGYCEFDFKSRTVFMCPPRLVLLPAYGLPKAVLTGARTPALIAKIKAAVKIHKDKAICIFATQRNKNINIPFSIVIEAIDISTIEDVGREAGVAGRLERPVAWDLVNASSSLDERRKSLEFKTMDELNWTSRIFDPAQLAFSRSCEHPRGLKFVKYKDPVTQQPLHWLWENGNAAEVDLDWGRYLALASGSVNVLLYDKGHHKLAVPLYVPLPCLLARAITMCTGMAPVILRTEEKIEAIPANYPIQIYSGVPPAIAGLIAEKLGQNIVEANFENLIKSGALYD